MKLKSVHIENYQAIQELTLPLDPSLTVFHGDNGHGKTSILGAIAVGLGSIPKLLSEVSGIGFLKTDQRSLQPLEFDFETVDRVEWLRTMAHGGNALS